VILDRDLCEKKGENNDSVAVNWQKTRDTLLLTWY